MGRFNAFKDSLSAALDPEMHPAGGVSLTNKIAIGLIWVSVLLGVAETEASLQGFGVYWFHVAEFILFGSF